MAFCICEYVRLMGLQVIKITTTKHVQIFEIKEKDILLNLLKSSKSNCLFPRITKGGDMNNLYEYCK